MQSNRSLGHGFPTLDLNLIGLLSCLTGHVVAVPGSRSFLGLLANRDDQQDHDYDAGTAPKHIPLRHYPFIRLDGSS
ncbi:MAG: hypothetical protein ABI273_14000 [Lacunisphaera sp.]